MQTIQALLLQVLLTQVPPGTSAFSVSPDACKADACDVATCTAPNQCKVPYYSRFYQAYVHQETLDEATERYRTIAEAAVDAVTIERCKTFDNTPTGDCDPNPQMKVMRGFVGALASIFGAAINESGLREDVQVGRGKSRHPDDAGGQGRGPGGEACLMQVHPDIAWRFVPDLTDDERLQASKTPQSREAVARTLLGKDRESLVTCFRTGLRMLAHAASSCAGEDYRDAQIAKRAGRKHEPFANLEWGMFSMYGTGRTCRSFNGGKTTTRVTTARVVADALMKAIRADRKGT